MATVIDFNRTKICFKVITLPAVITPEDYGVKECCEPYNVYAENTQTESWKNDVTSAWVKLYEQADSVTFTLYKGSTPVTNYTLQVKSFDKETYSKYVTINWIDVLAQEGAGCYTLEINSTIGGFQSTSIWGVYNLQLYSTYSAKGQVRLKAIFNQYHSIENIDFTNSNVVDTLRVYGFFGQRKPNYQIDNLIYQNRRIENIVREQLNSYELSTDPIKSNYTSKLLDLYLLSETDLYLTDHNFFNHVQTYKDFNVIVNESPEIDYKEFSNLASLKCILSDKIQNKRSYYNG